MLRICSLIRWDYTIVWFSSFFPPQIQIWQHWSCSCTITAAGTQEQSPFQTVCTVQSSPPVTTRGRHSADNAARAPGAIRVCNPSPGTSSQQLKPFPWLCGKESTCHCRRFKRNRFNSWVRKSLWSRNWQPAKVFLPGKLHGQRSLAGYSPWGHKELDTTEHAHPQSKLHVVTVADR